MADVLKQPETQDLNRDLFRRDLLDKLDSLWEQYLYLVDEYQNTRKQLSDALSTGFLALAQANFNSTSRTRYGQDFYDDRMQASRKVVIEPADEPWIFEVIKEKQGSSIDASQASESETTSKESEDVQADQETKNQVDPLRWFGILVPQALRNSQTSFTQAAEGPVPRLATLSRQMRTLEIEIGRLKKSIKKSG